MATMDDKREDDKSTKVRKNLDKWKYPKIPIYNLYKRKLLRLFPSFVIKDYEQILTFESHEKSKSIELFDMDFLYGFTKKRHKFLHLGLGQIAIKPLVRDGLDAPVTVRLRDARVSGFENSLLAVVQANLSQGPIYFNCFPSFEVSLEHVYESEKLLTLCVQTTGMRMALMVRTVCKAMVDLNDEYLKEPMLGQTIYVNSRSGTEFITQWDEVDARGNENDSAQVLGSERAVNTRSEQSEIIRGMIVKGRYAKKHMRMMPNPPAKHYQHTKM